MKTRIIVGVVGLILLLAVVLALPSVGTAILVAAIPIPNPQSPIPNPQSPYININKY